MKYTIKHGQREVTVEITMTVAYEGDNVPALEEEIGMRIPASVLSVLKNDGRAMDTYRKRARRVKRKETSPWREEA